MAWDFETDPEYQAQLDWADEFVRDEVEPLDLVWRGKQFAPPDERLRRIIDPLKDEVRKRRLWATHLGQNSAARDTGSSSCRC
jgi:acyl-CoA dehydrogenase